MYLHIYLPLYIHVYTYMYECMYECIYVYILDSMNNLPCNCTASPFTDANHWHIVSKWRYMYCPKQQIKETGMQRSQIHGTSFH